MSAEEVLERYDRRQLLDWQALAVIEGWGEENERTARLCAAMHNAMLRAAAFQRGVELNQDDLATESDFLPQFPWERPKQVMQPQTPEEIQAVAMRMAGFR